ncbi:MAG: hypothetical protein RMY27_23965 [Nostoc sp. DedQUE09]|nr:hypothetical protein [Nostoc sp. DedQUE09]
MLKNIRGSGEVRSDLGLLNVLRHLMLKNNRITKVGLKFVAAQRLTTSNVKELADLDFRV